MVHSLSASEATTASKTSARGSPAPASLLCFAKDPPGVLLAAVASLGRVTTDSNLGRRRGVSSGLSHQLDQTGRDVLVGRVSEMDGVFLQPYGNASRADEAGKVTIPIREAVSGIEDDAPRKGCLQAASAARNGRAEDLAEILISAVLKMALATAALSGDVVAKWQTA